MKENGNRNLKKLAEKDKVRKKPAVIFGTNDILGAQHGAYEIIANAIDEAREGYGNIIKIKIEEGNIMTVEDMGRGIPMDYNEDEQQYNWEIAFCVMYGSGKFDSSQYSNALGTNGLGLASMQFASEFMDVKSVYDGKEHLMRFERGEPVGQMVVRDTDEHSGTTIRFKPDDTIFIGIEETFSAEYFLDLVRRQAMLIEGLHIIFEHPKFQKPIDVCYKDGIKQFVGSIIMKPLLDSVQHYEDSAEGYDSEKKDPTPYKLQMELAFSFSRDESLVEIYHNGSWLNSKDRNLMVTGLERAVVLAFEDFGKSSGKLTKADKFKYDDIGQLLVCVGKTTAPGNRTMFFHQTKNAINNPFIINEFTQFVYNSMRNWLENDKKCAWKVLEEALNNKKAREEADKVSRRVISRLSKPVSMWNAPDGLTDCESTDTSKNEIYIVEGKSASGAAVTGRDPRYQAVIGLTGKPINCIKQALSKILNNEVVLRVIQAFGCGIQATSKHIKDLPKFDINKLRYGKIIICADADIDGKHITNLVLVMIYILVPELLRLGKVYVVQSPLFEIRYNDKSYFAYSDSEQKSITKELIDSGAAPNKIKTMRSKGLGENDSDMMWITTMCPETRRLVKVEYPENDSEIGKLFDAVMGNDIQTRKAMVDEYFRYIDTDTLV